MAQHKAVSCLALGVQALRAVQAYCFNPGSLRGAAMFLRRKNYKRHKHLQGENYEITEKKKIQGKKEIRHTLKSFLEGNGVIFTLISFSLAPHPNESVYNFKTVASNTNVKKKQKTKKKGKKKSAYALTLLW